jgi:hypothetical protein
MMRNSLFLYVLMLCLFSSISCSKKTTGAVENVNDERHTIEEKDINKLLNEKSYITINYSLNKKGIRDTFQYFIDSYMTDPLHIPEYDLMAVFKRNASMNIEFDGRKVLIELPLSVFVKKKTFLGDIDADGDLVLSLISELNIDPLWQFSTKTRLVSHSWTKKPKLNIGISIPIETLSNKILERIKPEIEKNIDDNMRSGFDLKSKIQNVSNLTMSPFRLNEVYGV